LHSKSRSPVDISENRRHSGLPDENELKITANFAIIGATPNLNKDAKTKKKPKYNVNRAKLYLII
jgi:hypothetical protein